MTLAAVPRTIMQANQLAAEVRAEIIGGFDRHDPRFQRSGDDEHGIPVDAPSLMGLPEHATDALGIDFARAVSQPLRNSRTCEAQLQSAGGFFTGRVIVSRCLEA